MSVLRSCVCVLEYTVDEVDKKNMIDIYLYINE